MTPLAYVWSAALAAFLIAQGPPVVVPQVPPVPPVQPPSEHIVFRATYTQASYPNLGWGSAEPLTTWTRAFLSGGGPSGQHAVRFAGVSGAAGQANWGNRAGVNHDVPANGSRFYRWRMRMAGNHCGGGWGGGGTQCSTMTNKLLIVGQGCGSNCRFILTYETHAAGIHHFRIQKDGGADLADTGPFPNGQWLAVQVEIVTSTGTSGGYKIWVNNGTYGSPNAVRTGIRQTNAGHSFTWFGGFMNDGLANAGTHSFDHTDFEISTAFNPNW